jgi:hypothetical protein
MAKPIPQAIRDIAIILFRCNPRPEYDTAEIEGATRDGENSSDMGWPAM